MLHVPYTGLRLLTELASSHTKEKAPWGALEQNIFKYIPAEFIPPGVTLKEPRSMQGNAIETALEFWRNREAEHGPSGAVKFSCYIDGHRKTVPARYGTRGDTEKSAAAAAARTKKRKRSRAKHPDTETGVASATYPKYKLMNISL